MNKAELVEALAQHYDGSKPEASRALNAVVQTITRSTVAGERVAITGFGVFEKVERAARMVRNPRTGERKEAPATSVPRFRAGTELKAYVAGQRELPTGGAAAPAPRTTTRRPAAAATTGVAATSAPKPATKKLASSKSGGLSADTTKAAVRTATKKTATKKAVAKKADTKKADTKKADTKKADTKKAAAKKSTTKGKKSKK